MNEQTQVKSDSSSSLFSSSSSSSLPTKQDKESNVKETSKENKGDVEVFAEKDRLFHDSVNEKLKSMTQRQALVSFRDLVINGLPKAYEGFQVKGLAKY